MKLNRLIFLLTNRLVDISVLDHGDDDRWLDSGLCLTVTLNLPLFLRRLSCDHRASHARGLTWCFRCERAITPKVFYANQHWIAEFKQEEKQSNGELTGIAPIVVPRSTPTTEEDKMRFRSDT